MLQAGSITHKIIRILNHSSLSKVHDWVMQLMLGHVEQSLDINFSLQGVLTPVLMSGGFK